MRLSKPDELEKLFEVNLQVYRLMVRKKTHFAATLIRCSHHHTT